MGAEVNLTEISIAVLGLVVGYLAKMVRERSVAARQRGRILEDLAKYVLPHFEPPAPGMPDNTLPTRAGRSEERLLEHLKDEEESARALGARLDSMDERLSEGTGIMAAHDEYFQMIFGALKIRRSSDVEALTATVGTDETSSD